MSRYLRTIVSAALVAAACFSPGKALGQTADELAAGRQLFAEALDDEEHQRFAAALEKYERVLRIKDTAATRYRIGVTHEGLGKIKEAVEAYSAAVRLGASNPKDADVAKASQARIDALEPKVAHLALRLKAPPPHAELKVDGEPVPLDAASDVRVNPGAHVVTATGDGVEPFRAEISLSEGGRAEIPVVYETKAAPSPPPPPPPPPPPSSNLPTIGIATAAAGAALVVAGVIVLGLRSGDISDLKAACPGGDCPRAREKELSDIRDRAEAEGPVGGVLVGIGAAAIATGAVLFVIGRKNGGSAAQIAPAMTAHGGFLTLRGGF